MWHWIKWAWITFGLFLGLFLKHLFKLLVLVGIGYGIIEWMYPELPDVDNFIKWYAGLSPSIQPQFVIGGVMVFGFIFHHLSAVATAKQKQVVDIKKTIAENITITSNQMCQVAIDTTSFCTAILNLCENIEHSKTEQERDYWWDYAHERCCEYGMKIDSALDIDKKFTLLRSMHQLIYIQLGLERHIECLQNIYRELTFLIIPITSNTKYFSDKEAFKNKIYFMLTFNLVKMNNIANDCNLEMARISGGITGRLISDLCSPTLKMLLILCREPLIFVGEMTKNAGECFAVAVKNRREALNEERENGLANGVKVIK